MTATAITATDRARPPDRRLLRVSPWRLALAAALTALIVYGLVRIAGAEALRAGLETAAGQPALIAAFAAAYTTAFWLRSLAWSRLLGRRLGIAGAFSVLQTALCLNHLLPVKAGDVARPYLASLRSVDAADGASSTILSRILDMLCLLAIAAVFLPLVAGAGSLVALAAPVALLGLAATAIALLRASRLADSLPGAPGRFVARMRASLIAMRPRDVLVAAIPTLASWLLEGVATFAVLRAAGGDIGLETAIAATAATLVFQAFHFTPGGIGVYEAGMAGTLNLAGVPLSEALALAVAAHAVKFAYSFTVGGAFAAYEASRAVRRRPAPESRSNAGASRFEIIAARGWNLLNEGKPFTVIFSLFVIALLAAARSPGLPQALIAALAVTPLLALFHRFDFPLKLRVALWIYLGLFLAVFQHVDLVAIALVLSLYFTFTVVIWGSVYYHLRIGMPLTNFTRFWRLVLENPDTTSGNFLEQAPKVLLVVLAFSYLSSGADAGDYATFAAFALLIAVTAPLMHQWFFTWAPAAPLGGPPSGQAPAPRARRVVAIVIDGCRADRLREAHTPFIDRLRREGTEFTDMRAVYPARTVTCFSSILSGAPPAVHGMRSNFVPSLGIKCDSLFTSLPRHGMRAKLVGIAHLVDAFGDENVVTVSARTHNDLVDAKLVERARAVMSNETPDLLVLQLISVDQTGHARGSYHDEYLRKIEESDRHIEEFLGWCEANGYLEGATVLITADHGQGIGIGGHGHLTPTELNVPCILWGAGVEAGVSIAEPRSILDIAPTLAGLLGTPPPEQSVGRPLLDAPAPAGRPVAVVIPAYNEAPNLPGTLAAVPRGRVPGLHVIVVDDGSSDGTADVARAHGAETVVRHERNRGLGAALRTGLAEARRLGARAAVYLDADGEYDPAEIPHMLAPIEAGEADYVLGSRFAGRIRPMRPLRRFGNRLLSFALSVAAGRWITDGQTGYRAFSERALAVAEIVHDYNYAQVLTLDMLRKGMRLAQIPISYRLRSKGRSFIGPRYLWKVPLGMARQLLKG